MAQRPIYIPQPNIYPYYQEVSINFEWHPGLSRSQAQKSILSLHESATEKGLSPLLEISSKSLQDIGIKLSAFNLRFEKEGNFISVESAYQGSKVFENDGPFHDLYNASSQDAKTDERLRNSGSFKGYCFFGDDFPDKPITAFYDWLYLVALIENPIVSEQLKNYAGFSDIAFNPKKSINCQARSAAIFVALADTIDTNLILDRDYWLDLVLNRFGNPSEIDRHKELPLRQMELNLEV
ncbi:MULTISPECIES: DUF6977 family protein [unclassified Chamaesiphon]|uniref:DarT1-associated NADAR antitoxin family protein n=1 Tax=unclassified Chamaesiphon TaxID=2620921 RepID=UPI00286D2CF8|nr:MULTISPECIES: hypothetical protein [unclassified Chamaesiphon]